ncbi:hypothetical protein ACHAXA_008493 [Cyclostephanos tholiformis]|uniref:Peptidase S1 domain-containing protein n=1 Tax=Cyclostephanos tholiformis TaxID=382380 RepID=A0ABD3RSX7_9STRA
MVAIPKKYTTIAVATVAIAAIAIALVYSQKKKSAYNALAASAAEGFTPRIIGGSVLDQGVWAESRRYLVGIKFIFEEDGAFRNLHNCGATLVSPQVVLTAAHCFTNLTTGSFMPGGNAIEYNRYSMDDDEGVGIIPLCLFEDKISCDESLAYVIRHPDYDFNTNENDVTLIILPDDQQVTTITPVTLNRDTVILGELYPITDDMLCARTDSFTGVAMGRGDSAPPTTSSKSSKSPTKKPTESPTTSQPTGSLGGDRSTTMTTGGPAFIIASDAHRVGRGGKKGAAGGGALRLSAGSIEI